MINRQLLPKIEKHCFKGKAILLFGARQAGKTTLVESITAQYQKATLFLSGDEPNNSKK